MGYVLHSILIASAYLVGAIPSGFIIARLKGIRDIRTQGSGNIGATNVARALGLKYFFIVFLVDACKAFGFLQTIKPYVHDQLVLFIMAAVLLLGNGYSIFLRGSGGKGVATSIGILAGLQSLVVPLVLVIWIALLLLTRIVGIASIMALFFLPFCAWYAQPNELFILFTVFVALWGLWRHQDNIYNELIPFLKGNVLVKD